MWFLIKGTFYCSMALVVLSFFGNPPQEETAGGPRLVMGDAITAATDAYQYVSAICVEKPEVCEKGKETFQALGQRAREGALVAFQLLDQQFTDDGTSQNPLPAKGRVEILKPAVETAASQAVDLSENLDTAAIVTGTVVPTPRPQNKNLPKPYTPPKL
ncbi:hypothetical protein PDO_1093 [Rhizobium sp. PDO1-076]|uniref:DUF5330 domain-containing protein n=1 Tax=Rhizobium sp. PDO1-076 TaxID=1125979 RepID=UPI00024E3702|nr:DUF5330 domain-containing protein [Rhizobium sp. PDO1-076]EHS53383.1 hypothetical protein PDO_1093 [Rhizobium sp. PDO1-076]